MKWLVLLLPAVLLVVCVSVLQSDIILVPSQQPTIQAGIDVAVDGDTVMVADGTYTGIGNYDIDFGGRTIVVMSENGPENCVIDCEGSETDIHRGFYFHNGEDSSSVVRGFTIQNGYVYGDWPQNCGGAVFCDSSSSPTIIDNTISGNTADSNGGGIYCKDSSPTIMDNTISGNTSGKYGGGIYCKTASPTIIGNTITGNTTSIHGGGIYCKDYSPTIIGNTISGNTSNSNGGGIYSNCNGSSTIIGNTISGNNPSGIHSGGTIIGNTITENIGDGIHTLQFGSSTIIGNTISGNTDGCGIYCQSGSPIITGNTISGNSNGSDGGGIYCRSSSFPTITSNTITGNRSGYGGGIYCSRNSSPTITGNTITGNRALEWGGGICCLNSDSVTITNTILWDNNANVGDEIWIGGDNYYPLVVTISYSDVEGGSGSVYIHPGGTLNWGNGMIDDDPLFVDPDKDDYHLMAGSPCIDAGDPDMPCVPWGGWWLDMGAYEYDQGFYFDGQNLIKKPFTVVFPDKR